MKSSLELTVRNPINSLTLDKDQTTILKDGYTSTITATTDPANYDGANISWAIADTSIATVTVSGKTAIIKSTSKIGQTTLTVSAGGITKTVNVSVVNFVTTTYSYTGTVQQVDLPAGTYKFECWGAQGGKWGFATDSQIDSANWLPGLGAYSKSVYTFNTETIIKILIGGQGTVGGGGGGSYYIGTGSTSKAGNTSFPNILGTGNETGHSGNGAAKITPVN